MEVEDEFGNIITNEQEVLHRWKHDFQQLLTPPEPENAEQVEFLNYIKNDNRIREDNMSNDDNAALNEDFTFDKVKSLINHAKSGKTPGIDGLINDVVKNDISTRLLQQLFNTCLRTKLIPTSWSKGIISPIPKSRDNNPRIPLNYRGIS